MEQEKIKKIISRYTRVPENEIGPQTQLDRRALASSILLHRMYADLAKDGFEVSGYLEIANYSMLLTKLNASDQEEPVMIKNLTSLSRRIHDSPGENAIGIDLEEVSTFPPATDFREEVFYTMYFSPSEISYCILQPDPMMSFAGLFAAKEAIVKANNRYKEQPFNTIIIDHLPNGKPIHADFHLSISHTPNIAVAIAFQKRQQLQLPLHPSAGIQILPPATPNRLLYVLSFSAIILAIITLLVTLWKL